MEFFDRIFLDNPVLNYFIVAGTILVAILLKKFLSRYLASVLYKLFHRVWGNVEKKHFIDLVVEPIELFLLILVILFSLDKLNFPELLKYKIYGIHTEDVLDKIGIGILIISFIWLLLRLIDFIAMVLEYKANLTHDQGDNQLIVFFKDFFKVILVLGGVLALLKFCFNQAIGPLVAGLGIAGAAIALASKESLENIIASFIIFFDKPFSTGDVVKVQNITGTIEKIGLRSTRIRTADKTLVSVPNKQMVDSIVDNHSMRTQRRAEIRLDLSPVTSSATTAQLVKTIRQLLDGQPEQIDNHAVFLKEISKTGLLVTVEFFTQPVSQENFDTLKEKINFEIKKILEDNQVELAGATNIIVTTPESE